MSELGIPLITNARIMNRNTRIENYFEPQYSLTPKSGLSYLFS